MNESTAHATSTDSAVALSDDERQRCEVWTRVMGYHRPVSSFNRGRKASTMSAGSSLKRAALG
ncbi:hypothetical protein [Bradyrhizobium yuanmingense]|uniref:Anaerobic ribonucleoside-triphosphate reductase n=1 Tax=Bradyrhizobium yuanmingense TaxID=108015 RepID=A0ABV4G7L6_9BRAD|nr:hypothetical protein [Bradyrhizobium yuanmingense]